MEKAIWNSMLTADLNVRYWAHLSRRYYNRDRVLRIFLACTSSGTVAGWNFWNDIPILWKVLSGISALVAIALPILNWQELVERMSTLRGRWTEIWTEYEILWAKYRGGEEIKTEEYQRIKRKTIKASSEESNLPYDGKLVNKCRDELLKSRGLRGQTKRS